MADDRLPDRNLVFLLDVSGSMKSPDKLPLVKHGDADAGRRARPARPGGHRRLRRSDWPGAALDARRSQDGHSPGDRRARGRRLDQRRRRHPARLPRGARAVHPRRHQPRHPRHRRRLQRRRHQPGRADAPDRAEARRAASSCPCSASAPATSRTRRWRSSPTRATATTRTSTRSHEARKVLVERGRRHARHHRQGREDPGRVQPAARSPATA